MIGAAILSAASMAFAATGIATPAEVTHYDCALSSFSAGDGSTARALNEEERARFGLPFALKLAAELGGADIGIDWKGDPFRLNGVHGAMWSREGRTWLVSGLWCEDGGDLCAGFVALTPKESGEANLTIMPSWPTKNHPTPWARNEFSGTCKPSENLK